MKLLLLLMLALPTLSSASSAQQNNTKPVLVLNPSLGNKVPKLTPKGLTEADTPPRIHRHNIYKRSITNIDQTNLEWQTWPGSLPSGAVSIYNSYDGRIDYVCKYRCESGFYNPGMGTYCHYPFKLKEDLGYPFEILVNKDNFEFLEWKDDSFGSVPQNAVNVCSGRRNIYVGRNEYGLGKVHMEHKRFYLPWKGEEYKYNHYQVLTVDTDIASQQISDVKYKVDSAKILKNPPETIQTSTITNNGCHPVSKTVTLSKKSQVEQRWDTSSSLTLGFRTTFTVQVPLIVSAGIELSAEKTFQWTKGTTHTEAIDHSVAVQYEVPPNHSCTVRMVGYKYESNIPYTARISRTYRNGKTTWASISGTYKGVQIGDVQAVVDRCVSIPNAKSCTVKQHGKG